MKYISVVQLDGLDNYLFKIGKRPDWNNTPIYERKAYLSNETVMIATIEPVLLGLCFKVICRAYLEVMVRKIKSTWYVVLDGRLTVIEPEFDEERTPM